MDKAKFIQEATRIFALKGYHVQVKDFTHNITETTFYRHFRHGVDSVFEEVLIAAAKKVYNAFEATEKVPSDPDNILLKYAETVITLFNKGGDDEACIRILLGAGDWSSARSLSSLQICDDQIYLDDLLKKSGRFDRKLAMKKIVIMGSLREFVLQNTGVPGEELLDVLAVVVKTDDSLLISRQDLEARIPKSHLRETLATARAFTASLEELL